MIYENHTRAGPDMSSAYRSTSGDASAGLSALGGFDLVQIARRNFALIFVLTAVGLALTAFWLNRQPLSYASTAAIMLRASETPSDTTADRTISAPVNANQVFTEAEVLSSRDFITRLAEQLNLIADPRYNPALGEPKPDSVLRRALGNLGLIDTQDPRMLSELSQIDAVVDKLSSQYSVTASEKHNVIQLSARSPDPTLSAEIANAAATQYIEMLSAEQTANLDHLARFLSQRSEVIASNIARLQTEVATLIQENELRDQATTSELLAEKASLRARLDAASSDFSRRSLLENRLDDITRALESRVAAEIQLAERELILSTETDRFDAVRQRLGELEAQREAQSPDAAQISRAERPRAPEGPLFASTLAVALVAFFLLGVLGAVLREHMNRLVLSPADAESATGMEVITSLPRLLDNTLKRHGGPHGVMAHDANGAYSNAVRALVTSVVDEAAAGRAPVAMIASAVSGEGKSSIASSMAVSASLDGLKVLLIDLDVYRQGSSTSLQAEANPHTLADLFSEVVPLTSYISASPHERLDVMTFKPNSRLPLRVFDTRAAQRIFKTIRRDYDLIIVDTPPFLASEEAARLAAVVDKAILVTRWRMCRRELLATTARRMTRSGFDVVGIAINGVSPRSAQAYGYYSYTSDYYTNGYA
ncbi:capsular exopolysaccharide family [Palleronia marisminoris]|uniref:non-specific protein-tyrosine kinase n=1 Tax=Palleronia marisminoris TaxID=315423 RepID=A0A1Y5S9T3_9RHOB|nr:polysaccharide biosynthesis tyrosine autokinase [Palleronia marisminoris]SFG68597.1 capsular exopolysaccharide family [Palleronia marisminoris]SLN35061.1 Tyrosine-protein kinase etk [Palleronia marisminoris]